MKNLKRGDRRRQMKHFAIGDWVVWSLAVAARQVVEVNKRGIAVDVSREKHVERVARTCQQCCGLGGHGEHSSIGMKHEFWQSCNACDGSGERQVVA